MDTAGLVEVTDAGELRELLGEPQRRVVEKVRTRLLDLDREWLEQSPFCLVATADADGNCDVSPKGDPAGHLALVLDDTTIALPERPGNRRADGFHNILANPHVGLVFLIPGIGETLRVNGRARLVREAPFFDRMVVKGHRPVLALVVEIDEIYHHCPKAFLRSKLWKPESWQPEAMMARVRAAEGRKVPEKPREELEERYRTEYADRLYR
ncbi:pyridoxamine 5'-phosphate oxidase family protein [Streptomyces sp. AV19]|uniref:pyridoxamine 5'-phosphate oxidase family protein n=1 Tax=Streptomyces sp. AV19 TaxID=2793068 RepID=UPI0018FED432|nr:pyridoxamine 5'-phosphate oxidase family protein [Streptomyces sp. AV19]MBH1937462.1 pyridoxamine 5'-phosphate oxidase family protein [Streptomyces sp. AV19]MDG4533765.1 pyridoxamine 5'-phosphate oxidase family protein [Streptomyces sp. AV19]